MDTKVPEDMFLNDEEFFDDILESDAKNISQQSLNNMKTTFANVAKVPVAPGEDGRFQNWGEDVFLEEKCFPELFPFGAGGYLSSLLNKNVEDMGFANYIRHRILSSDPKYRKNSTYVFFLLLVKELVHLKRCKQTYMRQATKLPNLSADTVKRLKKEDLARYNRSYEVFKTMRGTSMYYEEAKKNVMAILRQKGSPSLFLTLSCAEYSWEGLLKEIMETVQNRQCTIEEVRQLSPQEKNKLISENVIQSTMHFQKRIEKELKLMTYPKFFDEDCPFNVSSYYYRVEFQQRGAPHIHALLWLQDEMGKEAPTFWTADTENDGINKQADKLLEIEKIATMLISASDDSVFCEAHHKEVKLKIKNESGKCVECYSAEINFNECSKHKMILSDSKNCNDCLHLRRLVNDFQTHKHTFSCQKKNKVINIGKEEGHGRNDGKIVKPKISNYVHCRFNFPQFPLNKTTFILGLSKTLEEAEVQKRRKDLQKIKKYMIRQTFIENIEQDRSDLSYFESLSFIEFLHEVGMFVIEKKLENYSVKEKNDAYQRYLNALAASVRGTGAVFLKRETKDVFTNNFNGKLMGFHKANHDIQMVVDQV